MSHKRIIYTTPTGAVNVVIPADDFINQFDGTEAEAIDFIKNKDVPTDATNVQIVNDTDIPSDRTYRNLWKMK